MAKVVKAGSGVDELIETLPQALLLEITSKLDLESLCSMAPLCKSLRSLISLTLSTLSKLDLSDFSPTTCVLRRVLGNNKVLQSLTLDCTQLDDSSLELFAIESIQELVLLRCRMFSSYVFTAIGEKCPRIRIFTIEMRQVDMTELITCQMAIGGMLDRCLYLESLSIIVHAHPGNLWSIPTIRPKTVKALLLHPINDILAKQFITDIGFQGPDAYVHRVGTSSLRPISCCLQSLTLTLDKITDEFLFIITTNLHQLIELCLEDNPMEDPSLQDDLTNRGLQLLGTCRNLIRLSLTRDKNSLATFKTVNDVGILVLAAECERLESVRLGGFSKVTDAGYVSILHSCKNLKRLEIVNALFLSDLAFHDLADAPRSLIEVRLISCNLVTSETAESLSLCKKLQVLDLSGCRSVADMGLTSISRLCKLTTLNLSGADITDSGLSALGNGNCPIENLCLRGCKRITERGMVKMLDGKGIISKTLLTLDLGYLRGVSDVVIVKIAEACLQISNLCIRCCFFVTDASISALGSYERSRGKRSLRKLDIYNCCRLSADSSRLFRSPFFCGLRWLGVGKTKLLTEGKDKLLDLATKPGLNICTSGCEIGCKHGWQCHDRS